MTGHAGVRGLSVNMMLRNHQIVIKKISGIIVLWTFALLSVNALASDKKAVPQKLLVGAMVAPPFAMKTADGRWEGLSIGLIEMITRDLGVEYEIVEYNNFPQVLEAVEKGKLNLFTALAVTEPRETIVDFSHPFLTSGSAIAVPAVVSKPGLFHFTGPFIDRFASLDFLLVIVLLVLISLAAGTMVWFFERRSSSEMFPGKAAKGLWQGLWWAMVTMTTVGYGDKVPRTPGGRIVALIWMFSSIFLVASFTAAITASLTVGELSGKVHSINDLYNARVGSVADSASLNFLTRRGIATRAFKTVKDGLQATIDGKIDAFVHNEVVLKHLAKTDFPGMIQVLPEIFDQYYVSVTFPPGSALRETFNRTLLKILDSDDYPSLKERYIGPGR
jgi:ABC-type amino acid transport substrate-binding protein